MPGEDATEQPLMPRSSAPQVWTATVAETKFYWYDLLVEGGPLPDFRDPIGRYLRRMQFAIDGTMEKRLLYFLVARPRVRFDLQRSVSWSFFSLKLTIPVLIGADERKSTITIDLDVPFEATYKKPLVQVQDKFLLLNWGALVETLSIHDLIQRYDTGLAFPGTVLYVGQTHDPAGKLAKGQHAPVNRARNAAMLDSDVFLLIQRFDVKVDTTATDLSEEASTRTHTDMIEGALIGYFESDDSRLRTEIERGNRRDHLADLQFTYFLQKLTVDLGFEGANGFYDLESPQAGLSRRHLFECTFEAGRPVIRRLPDNARPLPSLSG
ncbi:hypothetical protein [Pseudoduganella umbonata]|uniref:Uncharacterized protein n=1 Tax=Pseudoduganella umbonata TaxID=864828 RepID=A0A4P8HXT4_9BURK|nr:hypothetical protein [Pseudoduganella umbonata]MBB3223307.1 hypothetical protein [Pseudoduganella umbonata]QCP13782.1 hypothetical protein FCL38_27635 [Pseudoduganella umbonata]